MWVLKWPVYKGGMNLRVSLHCTMCICVCVCVIVMKGLIWPLIRVDEGTFCKFLLGLCHGPGSYSLVVHSGGPASIHGQIMWDLKGDKLH